MSAETNLWLVRHAPVDGPRGVIHAPDAPADLGDVAALAALRTKLPAKSSAVCSPARRTRETALARGVLPAMSVNLPYARTDGLARNAGQPDATIAATAAIIALIIALLALSWAGAFWAALVAALSAAVMGWLAKRQIGGQTGDVLGGAEQVAETAILLLLAARLA